MDAAAVNIANVNTVGFRRMVPIMRGFQMVFADEIARSPGLALHPVIGGGASLDATYTDVMQGPLRPTGRPLDVALDGPGFLAVATPAGTRYTRAGNFQLNGRNELVTTQGYLVLGQGGAIQIAGTAVQIDDAGVVLVDGAAVDQLRVVQFPEPQQLLRQGENLYFASVEVDATQVDATGTAVRGGHLENANSNVVDELVHMIAVQRAYEMAARTVRVVDRTLGIAVQEIAGR